MSDRALRDEIEVLYGELKRERAKADAPLTEELSKARTKLQEEIAELTERRRALKARVEELETLTGTGEHMQTIMPGEGHTSWPMIDSPHTMMWLLSR